MNFLRLFDRDMPKKSNTNTMAKKTILCVILVILAILTNILIGMSLSNRRINAPRRDPGRDSQNRRIMKTNMKSTKYKEYEPLRNRKNRKIKLGNIKDPPNLQILRKRGISGDGDRMERRRTKIRMTYQITWNTIRINRQKPEINKTTNWTKSYTIKNKN